MLFTWSMLSNKYFSTMVRIQIERGHKVAMGGPYKYIRHPGYVGFIVMVLATPLSLGTFYALLMSGIATILLIIRTSLEDKTLKNELDGYLEYSNKVKYKLIPFIW
jgi:protein-S-isoprenylcysteine O-methyltransferase Ste14